MRLRAAALLGAAAAAAAATLNQFVVVRNIGGESPAVALALNDLDRDFYSATGLAAVVLTSPPAAGSLPNGTLVVYLGTTDAAPWLTGFTSLPPTCWAGWEAHCVVALPAGAQGTAGYQSIVATGVGTRGAIFAAYTFSDAVLGFKPLFLFTDTPPARADPADIVIPDDLSLVFAPPQYKYRCIFPNDEDLTSNHRADPLGRNVFDLAAWDVFFATALRMKANCALIGTNPFPDDTATALAARRGIVISHHHYDLVGSNVFSWPLPPDDWDWATNAGTMSYVWRASIAAQADYPEVVWSTGLRGLNDEPYAACAGNDPSFCGETISQVMANQTAWIRSYPNQANATIMLYMWDELLPLLSGGYLTIPEGVKVVFTDAGDGYVRTDGNWTEYAAGCYYHTAMYNYAANQLTEMVPVSRIAQQLLNVVTNSKSTDIFVLNLSDLKPVPLTTAAVFDLIWNPAPWNATQDFNATARAWYSKFAQDYLQLATVDATTYALLWEAYFNVGYIFNGESDNTLAAVIASFGSDIMTDWRHTGGVTNTTVGKIASQVASLGGAETAGTLATLNASAWQLLSAVPAVRRGFYASHTLMQFTLQLAGVQALLQLQAAAEALNGLPANPASAAVYLGDAVSALDQLLAVRRITEGDAGAWSGAGVTPGGPIVNIPAAWPLRSFYLSDTLSDMQAARGSLASTLLAVQSGPSAPQLPFRPSSWYEFEAFQQALAPNYPLAAFNPAWNLPTWVRTNCVVANVSAGICTTNPDGGIFARGSAASVTLQVMTSQTVPHDATRQAMAQLRRMGLAPPPPSAQVDDGQQLVIRYTTDGSVPVPTSPPYVAGAPLLLSSYLAGGSTVTIRAMAWIDGVATGQVVTTTWQAV